MKIVNLNRNFTIHKNHGFEVGIKFDMGYSQDVRQLTTAIKKVLGSEAFMWKYYYGHDAKNVKGDWASAFGRKDPSTGMQPYWIYLRKESMLSLVMLSLDHTRT